MFAISSRQWLRPLPVLRRSVASKAAKLLSAKPKTTRPNTGTRETSSLEITNPRLPKLIITPGSKHHNDLPSFLAYAKRNNLDSSKTVYVGTHYEYTVALALLRLGFSLIRTGRRSDNGIDLLGHWEIPNLPESIRVIVQCKANKNGLSPEHIRELEGAFQSTPQEFKGKTVFGLLVSTKKATSGMLDRLGMNRWPMGFMKVTRTGEVEQFIWNRSAAERGLEGVGVTARYPGKGAELAKDEENKKEFKGILVQAKAEKKTLVRKRASPVSIRKEIQLTWMGRPIFADREALDNKTVELGREISSADEEVEPEPKRKRGRPKKDAMDLVKPRAVKSKRAEPKATKMNTKKSEKVTVDVKAKTRGRVRKEEKVKKVGGPKKSVQVAEMQP